MNELRQIEERVAYIVFQSWLALSNLIQKNHNGITLPLLLQHLSLLDIERFAPFWTAPSTSEGQANLVRQLSEKYPFDPAQVPQICQKLNLEPLPAEDEKVLAGGVYPFLSQQDAATGAVMERLEWIALPKGDILFNEGDAGDSLYIPITGRVRVVIHSHEGEKTIGERGRGQVIGEMAVITGEPRSGTIYAIRDTELVRLSKADFEQLIEKYPYVLMQTTRFIINRLRETLRPHPQWVSNIVLVPLAPNLQLTDLVIRLEKAMKGSILRLNSQCLDDHFGSGTHAALATPERSRQLITRLDEQEANHQFILYETDSTLTNRTKLCIQQADRILLVANANSTPSLTEIEHYIHTDNPTIPQELILLHPDRSQRPSRTSLWLPSRSLAHHHHLALKEDRDIRRLARHLTGNSLGLALGAGGARGFAHIGVLRALEEAGIEIDVVGGTSVGAVMGALYAMGLPPQDVFMAANQIFKGKRVLDYTLPMISFARSALFTHALQAVFGDTEIPDLWLNYFCVSANLTTAKSVAHRRGEVWFYTRASASIPGMFPPVMDRDEVLVDGGVFNIVPTDFMTELCKGGTIIAVDLTQGAEFSRDYNFPIDMSGWKLLLNRVNPFATHVKAPSIMDIITRASMITTEQNRAQNRQQASLYIELPLQEFPILEVKNQEALVEMGYRHAQQALTQLSRA